MTFLLFFLIISLSSADFDHAWSGFLSLQIEIATWWRSHWKSCELLKWNCKTWFNFAPKCIFHCSFKNFKKNFYGQNVHTMTKSHPPIHVSLCQNQSFYRIRCRARQCRISCHVVNIDTGRECWHRDMSCIHQ